eukprot:2333084-Amphidinium_carterae.1
MLQSPTLSHLMLALLDMHVSHLEFPYPVAMRWTRGLPSMPHLSEYQACGFARDGHGDKETNTSRRKCGSTVKRSSD